MDEQFEHPKAADLLSEIKRLFQTKQIFQKQDRPIIFLCGGPVVDGARNMRREFLIWSRRNLPSLNIILAEDAFKHTKSYDPIEVVNLSDFEAVIASIADCVLLFPESAGSFAELGLFSGNPKVKKKILVANRVNFQSKQSFVNLGPIRTIDRWSVLRPTILVEKRRGRFDFRPLKERIEALADRPRRKSFRYVTYRDLQYIGKLLVSLELISIFRFVTVESLYQSVRTIFDSAKASELRRILSILTGMGYVRVRDEFYFLADRKTSLLEFDGFIMESMKVRMLLYYKEYRKQLYLKFTRARNDNR
jgi:hypothetical protein